MGSLGVCPTTSAVITRESRPYGGLVLGSPFCNVPQEWIPFPTAQFTRFSGWVSIIFNPQVSHCSGFENEQPRDGVVFHSSSTGSTKKDQSMVLEEWTIWVWVKHRVRVALVMSHINRLQFLNRVFPPKVSIPRDTPLLISWG